MKKFEKSSGYPLFKISGKKFGFCGDISFAKSDIYGYERIMKVERMKLNEGTYVRTKVRECCEKQANNDVEANHLD